MTAAALPKSDFYRAFLMARASYSPSDFGIELSKEDFIDQMADEFNDTYAGRWSVDEMLLHPREALHFCD